MNELALFAGAGGGILGGKLLGWRTVCAVERDPYARDVLVARQNDGCLAPFPIWDDVRTFDGHPWRGRVDVVSGGFPCQDISAAGKGAGIDGERSGMWVEMARIIGEVRPRFSFVENSPVLTSRGLGRVLGDLASLGYNARWGVVGAHHAGAPHKRDRIWIVATDSTLNPREQRRAQCAGLQRAAGLTNGGEELADARCPGFEPGRVGSGEATDGKILDMRPSNGGEVMANSGCGRCGAPHKRDRIWIVGTDSHSPRLEERERKNAEGKGTEPRNEPIRVEWWESEPDVGRVAHGVAARVDRLRCIGNGQVPAVAALAWNILSQINAKISDECPSLSQPTDKP